MLDEAAILRRIEFVLGEARAGLRQRDQAVTFTMRVISNFYSIGKDAGSAEIKRKTTRMSRGALELRDKISEKEWLTQTINEHQEPLQQTWKWIVENRNSLTSTDVAARFRRRPMVVVTKQEDALLRPHATLGPDERYHQANITVLKLGNDGKWVPYGDLLEQE